jgi:hypothetical protein
MSAFFQMFGGILFILLIGFIVMMAQESKSLKKED